MALHRLITLMSCVLSACSAVRQQESELDETSIEVTSEIPGEEGTVTSTPATSLDSATEQLLDSEQSRMVERLRDMANRFAGIRKSAVPRAGAILEKELFRDEASSLIECVTGFQGIDDQPVNAIRQFHSSMHVVETDEGEKFLQMFRFSPRDGFTSTVIPSSSSSEETRFNFAKSLDFGLEFGSTVNTVTVVRDTHGMLGIRIFSGEELSLDGEQGMFHQVTYCF